MTAIRHTGGKVLIDQLELHGARNYTAWVHRFFRFNRYGTQLAPTSGSMAMAFPRHWPQRGSTPHGRSSPLPATAAS